MNWTPNEIESKIAFWLDANDASTIYTTTGDKVTHWSSKVGLYTLQTAPPSPSPTYVANAINSLSAIELNNTVLTGQNTPTTKQSQTWYVVAQPIGQSGLQDEVLKYENWAIENISSTHYDPFILKTGTTPTRVAPKLGVNSLNNIPGVYTIEFNRSTDLLSYRFNGKVIESGTRDKDNPISKGMLMLGLRHEGYIGEILCVNSVDPVSAVLIETYLANKWNFELDLHPDHPNSGPLITWNLKPCNATKYFEVYRSCRSDEYIAPLDSYEKIATVNRNLTSYHDTEIPGCQICNYFVAAANPKTTTYPPTGWFDKYGKLITTDRCCDCDHETVYMAPLSTTTVSGVYHCTPTPTPTFDCIPYTFEIGDPGVTYQRCMSKKQIGVKYVKCVVADDDPFKYDLLPTPIPIDDIRPFCPSPTPTYTPVPTPSPTPTQSPTPTPTHRGEEYEPCYPTPTPTVTPPPTPTPTITPTPTPTCPWADFVVTDDNGNDTSNITFVEGKFNDSDVVTITYNNLTTGLTGMLYKDLLLLPNKGTTVLLPIGVNEEVEIHIHAKEYGQFPPATIDIIYNNTTMVNNLFIDIEQTKTINVTRLV